VHANARAVEKKDELRFPRGFTQTRPPALGAESHAGHQEQADNQECAGTDAGSV